MNNEVLKPERLKLLDFLNRITNSQFVIPVYQRNYIWQAKKQVKKFLEDYSDVLKNSKDSHFIGVVMYLTIPKSVGFFELSVVDGQQRIITIFLIMQALKEIANQNGNHEFAELIETKYLTNSNINDDIQKLKLKPLVSDDDVYKKIILDYKDSILKEEKRSNVYINYMYIKEFLREQYGMYPIELIVESLNKFYFVAIPLSQKDNAQEIFESINSAGAELSKADLIRNYILMNMNSSEQEYLYAKYWQPLEELFSKSGKIESFFRMFLANQTRELSNLESIYNVFQKWFIEQKEARGKSIEKILEIIFKYANYYFVLYIDSNSKIDPIVDQSLNEFKKSSIEPTAPILMEIYNLYNQKKPTGERFISAESFGNIIELFNSYNIRRNLCNLRTGVLTRIIPPMLENIINECNGDYSDIYNITIKYLVDKNINKASFMPDNAYLKANLVNINAYSLRNYVKIAFEKIESHNNPAVINFSNLSIEHLMPQTPTKEWVDYLNITKEEYDYQLHRIGNLTLATHSDNSKMSNNPFEYKKAILQSTQHLKMNIELLQKENWFVSDIEERTNEIVNKISELYPYVSSGKQELKKYDVFYKKENNKVQALIFEDGTIEIQTESYFEKPSYGEKEIQDLIDEGVLSSIGNGYTFTEVYTFENLKKASDLIIENYSSEWEEWTDSLDYPLNFDIRIKIYNSDINLTKK